MSSVRYNGSDRFSIFNSGRDISSDLAAQPFAQFLWNLLQLALLAARAGGTFCFCPARLYTYRLNCRCSKLDLLLVIAQHRLAVRLGE